MHVYIKRMFQISKLARKMSHNDISVQREEANWKENVSRNYENWQRREVLTPWPLAERRKNIQRSLIVSKLKKCVIEWKKNAKSKHTQKYKTACALRLVKISLRIRTETRWKLTWIRPTLSLSLSSGVPCLSQKCTTFILQSSLDYFSSSTENDKIRSIKVYYFKFDLLFFQASKFVCRINSE